MLRYAVNFVITTVQSIVSEKSRLRNELLHVEWNAKHRSLTRPTNMTK